VFVQKFGDVLIQELRYIPQWWNVSPAASTMINLKRIGDCVVWNWDGYQPAMDALLYQGVKMKMEDRFCSKIQENVGASVMDVFGAMMLNIVLEKALKMDAILAHAIQMEI